MQPHPAELARAWYAQSVDDVASARALLEDGRFATCCFLCQQSAEKALKGLLYLLSGDAPRTHAVADLLRELGRYDSEAARMLAEATALDPFFVSTRYPDAIAGAIPAASFHRAEAELALARADLVSRLVGIRLPKDP